MEQIVGARSPNFDLMDDDAAAYRRTCLVSQINTCACRSADTPLEVRSDGARHAPGFRVWCGSEDGFAAPPTSGPRFGPIYRVLCGDQAGISPVDRSTTHGGGQIAFTPAPDAVLGLAQPWPATWQVA